MINDSNILFNADSILIKLFSFASTFAVGHAFVKRTARIDNHRRSTVDGDEPEGCVNPLSIRLFARESKSAPAKVCELLLFGAVVRVDTRKIVELESVSRKHALAIDEGGHERVVPNKK
jgi:hypothetical protein